VRRRITGLHGIDFSADPRQRILFCDALLRIAARTRRRTATRIDVSRLAITGARQRESRVLAGSRYSKRRQ
jgi:hypothetical protein